MAGEMEKVEALEKASKNPLVILFLVIVGVGWLLVLEKNDRKDEIIRQEERMERLFDNSNGVIEKNTRAFQDQKDVITELKIIIENKE